MLRSAAATRAWAQDVALLKAEHERLVATIAAVSIRRYGVALPGGKKWTVGEQKRLRASARRLGPGGLRSRHR